MRLLIAEDERELAKALKTIFERHNYGVDVVFDGQTALDYAPLGRLRRRGAGRDDARHRRL